MADLRSERLPVAVVGIVRGVGMNGCAVGLRGCLVESLGLGDGLRGERSGVCESGGGIGGSVGVKARAREGNGDEGEGTLSVVTSSEVSWADPFGDEPGGYSVLVVGQ